MDKTSAIILALVAIGAALLANYVRNFGREQGIDDLRESRFFHWYLKKRGFVTEAEQERMIEELEYPTEEIASQKSEESN